MKRSGVNSGFLSQPKEKPTLMVGSLGWSPVWSSVGGEAELAALLGPVFGEGLGQLGQREPVGFLAVDQGFDDVGGQNRQLEDAGHIRAIDVEGVSAGLPYFNPHSFRNTLVQLGQEVCKTPEQFKAWSQNLLHEKVLTTFLSYGEVACQRQGEIIRELGTPQSAMQSDANEIAEAVFIRLCESGAGKLGK